MKKIFLPFLLLAMIFSGCRKIIDVDIDNATSQVVIEGKIVNQLADQTIKLSKSVALNEPSVYPKISGATVTVTDSRGNNYTFRETVSGTYVNRMTGVPGVTYHLKVLAEGQTYEASSTMPNRVPLDSIGVVKNSFFGEESLTAAAYLKDPAGETNYYHFTVFVNSLFIKRIYVNNDRLTNGNNLRVQFYYNTDDDGVEDLKSGDRVNVEMNCIDANIFDYWYSLSQQSGNGPNQGTTPSNPPSNLSNNALGYFSAQTTQRRVITVP